MRLIYLDTSHLSLLGRLMQNDPVRFHEFVANWKRADMMLCFSRSHLMECLQHADRGERRRRYAALASFLPIASDVLTRELEQAWPLLLIDREIVLALIARGRVVPGVGSEQWVQAHTHIFPYVLDQPSDVFALEAFDAEPIPTIVGMARDAIVTQAAANSRPADSGFNRTKLSGMSDTPLSSDEVEDWIRQLTEATENVDVPGVQNSALASEAGRAAMDRMLETARGMYRRAGEVGMRLAYAETMGIAAGLETDARFLDEITQDIVFASAVRRVAGQSLHIDNSALIDNLVENLSRSMCPGTWLSGAVELEIRRAECKPDPSNSYDLEHVGHFPYVDIFFADRRIAAYLRQVLRREGVPPGAGAGRVPISTGKSIDALERALF